MCCRSLGSPRRSLPCDSVPCRRLVLQVQRLQCKPGLMLLLCAKSVPRHASKLPAHGERELACACLACVLAHGRAETCLPSLCAEELACMQSAQRWAQNRQLSGRQETDHLNQRCTNSKCQLRCRHWAPQQHAAALSTDIPVRLPHLEKAACEGTVHTLERRPRL